MPFPLDSTEQENPGIFYELLITGISAAFSNHPAVITLRDRIGLNSLCGYVVLLRTKVLQKAEKKEMTTFDGSPKKIAEEVIKVLPDNLTFEDYVLLDCVFGIPLFHSSLNRTICERLTTSNILEAEK